MHDVVIAGGGIGGLAAAVALQARGLDVGVYEAAPELRAVGAGIVMPPNAMRVLEGLGLAGEVEAAGVPLDAMEVRDAAGGRLQVMDGAGIRARWGSPLVALPRSALQRILADALAPGTLRTGRRLAAFRAGPDGVAARFEDGGGAEGRLLVGADGLRSATRAGLFPEVPLRYAGQTCFRALAPFRLPAGLTGTAWELWGGAARFGFAPVGPAQTYWFAPLTAPEGGRWPRDELPGRLAELYRAFPSPVPEMIAATPPAAIHHDDLHDLAPLARWHRGRVGLLGDAAHAATPNLGQGGAQALEDAVALARRVAEHGPCEAALAALTSLRRPRAVAIVGRSRLFGRAAHLEGRIPRTLRNLALRAAPNAVQQRQMGELFTPVV